jgi:hypothetical protein
MTVAWAKKSPRSPERGLVKKSKGALTCEMVQSVSLGWWRSQQKARTGKRGPVIWWGDGAMVGCWQTRVNQGLPGHGLIQVARLRPLAPPTC